MSKKIIVITGASGGVGGMLSLGLAEKGNHIVCLGRREEALLKIENEINAETQSPGGSASHEIVDMLDAAAVKSVGAKIKKEYGRIDVWINNVGVNNHNAIGPTWKLDPENWWSEVSSNLFTAYLGTATAINLMEEANDGCIINLGGGGVQKAKPFGSAYGAAKTGIVKFTETVQLELQESGLNIKVFAFNPGFIRNERTERLVDSDVCKKYMPGLEQTLKHGKMSDIQDSIELIDTLTSGRADALSGRYFLAGGKSVTEALSNQEQMIRDGRNLLQVK